jgi:HSP20 family molecular chaperone IbpA
VSVPKVHTEASPETVQNVVVDQLSDDAVMGAKINDEDFQLELDVPGVTASNIDITITGDDAKTLTVNAKREFGKDSDGSPRTKELKKSFRVDELVDTAKIKANLNSGVLRISAPKDSVKAEAKVKKIAISNGDSSESGSDEMPREDESPNSDEMD